MGGMEFSDPERAGDGGVELSLGLSIGGSHRRAPNPPGPARHGSRIRLRLGDAVDDLDWSLPFDRGDPFGRQEGRKDGIFGEGNGVTAEDRAALEAQALESRARDRAGREREAFVADCRRQSDGPFASITGIPGPNPNPVAYGSRPFPAMVMQYPHHHVQYVPVPNGLGFPFAMPCWAPAVSPVAAEGSSHSERNLFLPVACRGLPVSASAANASRRIGGGCYLHMKSVGINGASSAIDSPASSSSGVLEHRSGSLRGLHVFPTLSFA